MPQKNKFNDESWKEDEWRALLEKLISEGMLSWKEVATLTLGHMNPSQVGTSLASSEGFKRKYGKGQVMAKVMDWFYQQDGKCHDCGTRLELQADHNTPREEYEDPLDADFIENMVLRCRRCNVIKRPSHEFGGATHLTAETALMWILFSFRPRTLLDFVRMCRLYGMTMADVRMQEGWAMAHWLQKVPGTQFLLDSPQKPSTILAWPDGGITRCWPGDEVPGRHGARVLFDAAYPEQHIVALAHFPLAGNSGKIRVQALRYRVGNIPFSHYFDGNDGQSLGITYTPPKRRKNGTAAVVRAGSQIAEVEEEAEALEQMEAESEQLETTQVDALPEGAKINLLAPRGMVLMGANLVARDAGATIRWTQRQKEKAVVIAVAGRGKKVCELQEADLIAANFQITLAEG